MLMWVDRGSFKGSIREGFYKGFGTLNSGKKRVLNGLLLQGLHECYRIEKQGPW